MSKRLNFSWVIPNLLAGSAIPTSKKDLEWLVNKQKIKTVVSLTEYKLSARIKYFEKIRKELKFKYYNVPTLDGTGFYIHQFEKIIKIFNETKIKNERMLVHCEGGFGRTSTILTAIWMVHYRKKLNESMLDLKKEGVRPQAIYTDLQFESLKEWENIFFKIK